MGYHTRQIKKGVYGESSKLLEEVEELIDAEKQKNKVMGLVELSDLVGAIQGYLECKYPNFSLQDLETMARATRSAFRMGAVNEFCAA